jgi:hypothetical protein
VYVGGGHGGAVLAATKVLKREAAAVKKSVDSKRRRERERREREREREKQMKLLAAEEGCVSRACGPVARLLPF